MHKNTDKCTFIPKAVPIGDAETAEVKLLRPRDLLVDRTVQRYLDRRHVAKLAREYNPSLFGLGTVSLRTDGRFYVIDSQHRVEAAKSANMADVPVMFHVYRGLSLAQEAELFDKLNKNRKAVDAISLFRVRVVAGDPVAVAIDDVLNKHNLKVAASNMDGTISAIKAVELVHLGKVGTKKTKCVNNSLLDDTLSVLSDAWGQARDAFDRRLLVGVGGLLKVYGDRVDNQRLSRVLAAYGPPRLVFGEINGYMSIAGVTMMAASNEVLRRIYNKHLPKKRQLD